MMNIETLKKVNFEEERQRYIDFMSDPGNIMNCESCPEKRDNSSWEMPLPCSQQNCWVELHCKRQK